MNLKESKLQKYLSQHSKSDEQIALQWKNLNYSILVKDAKKSRLFHPVHKNKVVLNDLSGSAISGELLAVIGPSGCGKTSLLNVLASRVSASGASNMKLTGKVLVNGKMRNELKFRKQSAYVLQDDKLYAHLTVFETLMLSAQFYLSVTVTNDVKSDLVMSVISELGLLKAKDTIIGDEKVRGVSGGERKRVNIACQLISNPKILFLDEPTSGLDSFQAMSVMESMKNMAMNNRIVVASIHQPRSSIFDMFDKLLLMSEGRVMYYGKASGAISWFSSCGFQCPRLFNPSDYFLDILSLDNRSKELDEFTTNQVNMLGKLWAEHAKTLITASDEDAGAIDVKIHEEQQNNMEIGNSQVNNTSRRHSTNTTGQSDNDNSNFKIKIYRFTKNLSLLSWRSWNAQMRDTVTVKSKIFSTIFFACVASAMYNKAGDDATGIYDRLGLLFIVSLNQCFNAVLGVLNTFPKEKVIVNRERNANAYDTFSYFFAKYITEMPFNVVPPIIFSCIIYFIVGLNNDTFVWFLLITMLLSATGIALGLAVSAAVPNVEAANALGPPLVIIALVFGGFYINLETLPPVAEWIPYFSLIRWAFEALCINEFEGQTFQCNPGNPPGCVITGESVLEGLGFGGHTVNYAVFGLGMVLLGFLFSALFFLYISKGTFLNMSHVGSKQKHFATATAATMNNVNTADVDIVKSATTVEAAVSLNSHSVKVVHPEVVEIENNQKE